MDHAPFYPLSPIGDIPLEKGDNRQTDNHLTPFSQGGNRHIGGGIQTHGGHLYPYYFETVWLFHKACNLRPGIAGHIPYHFVNFILDHKSRVFYIMVNETKLMGGTMLKLSNRGLYGIGALYELAKSFGDEPVPIREISERHGLPIPFLEQVLHKLKLAGSSDSRRGVNGGIHSHARRKRSPSAMRSARSKGPLLSASAFRRNPMKHRAGRSPVSHRTSTAESAARSRRRSIPSPSATSPRSRRKKPAPGNADPAGTNDAMDTGSVSNSSWLPRMQ